MTWTQIFERLVRLEVILRGEGKSGAETTIVGGSPHIIRPDLLVAASAASSGFWHALDDDACASESCI